jgi:tetratricopeptide (TPR) repeat protein
VKETINYSEKLRNKSIPAILFAAIAFFLIVWYAIPWQIGDMFAEHSPPSDVGAGQIASFALRLAPDDPQTNSFAGFAALADFDNFDPRIAVNFFENAARLAPFDYRYWSNLGRAYEKAERFDDAERAFKRAISLAPEYSNPRWHYGNFLLRRGRDDEAIEQLRKAAQYDSIYREQAFAIAWNYFGEDTDKVDQFAANNPDAYATLARFYASRGHGQDALRIWNRIAETDKPRFNWIGSAIAQLLYEKGQYRTALEFVRQTSENRSLRPDSITNGGFESRITDERFPKFEWFIARSNSSVETYIDSRVAHTGSRSARLTFKNFSLPTLDQLWQVVAISSAGKYRLTFWAKNENLRGGSLPLVEVATADGKQTIAASKAFQTGSGGWEKFVVEFNAGEDTQGVIIRIGREPCAADCALVGTIWFDDFELEKL